MENIIEFVKKIFPEITEDQLKMLEGLAEDYGSKQYDEGCYQQGYIDSMCSNDYHKDY